MSLHTDSLAAGCMRTFPDLLSAPTVPTLRQQITGIHREETHHVFSGNLNSGPLPSLSTTIYFSESSNCCSYILPRLCSCTPLDKQWVKSTHSILLKIRKEREAFSTTRFSGSTLVSTESYRGARKGSAKHQFLEAVQ